MNLNNSRFFCLSVFIFLSVSLSFYNQCFAQSTASSDSSFITYIHGKPHKVVRLGSGIPTQPLATNKGKPMYPPGEIVVRYFDNASANDKARVRAIHNYTVKRVHKYVNAETLKVPSTMSPDSYTSVQAMGSLCSEIMKDPGGQVCRTQLLFLCPSGWCRIFSK